MPEKHRAVMIGAGGIARSWLGRFLPPFAERLEIAAAPSVRAYLLIGEGPRGMTGSAATWGSASGWRRQWLPRLAAFGRCRLDADGAPHTRALLVRRGTSE